MRKLIAIFGFIFLTATVYAQVGGITTMPPEPDQIATNQNGDPLFTNGNWNDFSFHASCMSIGTAPLGGNAAIVGACAGGALRVFDFTGSLHDHEAFLTRWKAYASAGTLTTEVYINEIFDNCHGDGTGEYAIARNQPVFFNGIASNSWIQGFQEYYVPIDYHGSDTSCVDTRFYISSPAWPGASKSVSLNQEIVDSNGNIEEVTTAGTTGSPSAPSWNATTGGTTTDGTATWTNEGQNPPVYITNVEWEEDWFPIRTFLLYPNYRGYLWSDLVPPKRFTQIQPVSAGSFFWNMQGTGSASVAGEVMGVDRIDPPNGDTLSQLTLTVTMATVAGCGSGVLATDTFSSPQSIQPWQFTPSQYGSLTVGSSYYVCSSLYLTSGPTLIDSFPDYKIYYENSTFRAGLTNWFDPNSVWYQNQSPKILIGTYDRWSATYRANTTAGQTTEADYVQGVGSLGPVNSAPQAINAPVSVRYNGSFISDYCQQGFTATLSAFGTFSAIIPPGISGENDQLTPYLQTYHDYCPALTHWNILNNWGGYLINENGIQANPTFSPTVTVGTGSISANYLFLEYAAQAANYPSGDSPPASINPNNWTTTPSNSFTVNLSAATCAGTNCGVTFTMPICQQLRQLGGYLYAATGSTSTPPPNSSFQRQFVTVSGTLGNNNFIPCGASVSITSLTNGPPPPSTDTSMQNPSGYDYGRPFWVTQTTTDESAAQSLFSGMSNSTYLSAVGGMYMCDECSYYSRQWLWEFTQFLYNDTTNSANLNLPVSCVEYGPGTVQMWRDLCDRLGHDPYPFGQAQTSSSYSAGDPASVPCAKYGVSNVIATDTSCHTSTTDAYVDDSARWTFGARPFWNVVQQYSVGTYDNYSYSYGSMYQQFWKCVIDEQVYGSLGTGCLSWGFVSSSGLEAAVAGLDITQAWFDSRAATSTIVPLESILETPVEDSPILGVGTIVSGVSSSVSASSACSINLTSVYTNTSIFPDAPAWFVTHTDPVTGDQYILSNNLCQNSSTFTETFGIANLPSGATKVQVLNQGRLISIQTSGCPNGWTDCFTDNWLGTSAWAASHSYSLGNDYIDTNGNVEQVTTAGTSGSIEPTNFPPACTTAGPCASIGQTTTDGTATVTCEGPRNIINDYVIYHARGVLIH